MTDHYSRLLTRDVFVTDSETVELGKPTFWLGK